MPFLLLKDIHILKYNYNFSCDGLSSCVVNLSTDLFENPCIGTYKSLEVLYVCAKRDTNQSVASK